MGIDPGVTRNSVNLHLPAERWPADRQSDVASRQRHRMYQALVGCWHVRSVRELPIHLRCHRGESPLVRLIRHRVWRRRIVDAGTTPRLSAARAGPPLISTVMGSHVATP